MTQMEVNVFVAISYVMVLALRSVKKGNTSIPAPPASQCANHATTHARHVLAPEATPAWNAQTAWKNPMILRAVPVFVAIFSATIYELRRVTKENT